MLAKRFAYVSGAMLCLSLASGCASTRITSQADPTRAQAAYDTVMVYAAFQDLDMRQLGENELKAGLAARGVVCHRASDVFFPGGTYDSLEAHGRLLGLGIKAILVVAAYDAGTSETYVPPTYYTRSTGRGRATTTTSGGQTYIKPWVKFQGDLFDVRSERRAWVATANTKGNAWASGRTLLRSLCAKVVRQLGTDGLVPSVRRSR